MHVDSNARDSNDLHNLVRAQVMEKYGGGVVDELMVKSLVQDAAPLLGDALNREIVNGILADLHGMGPLETFLSDESVSDVLVMPTGQVWVERYGNLQKTEISLERMYVTRLIERIVAPLGLHVDRASPMVDARLPDGSRVNVVLAPISIDGPTISIRRFTVRKVLLTDFAPASVVEILRAAIKKRLNIMIIGATGSGKTTLLNALCGQIDNNERVITIEDTAELQLSLPHVIRLEARPANNEGVGEITLRQLVRNALRMRPDRLVVGEVRGAEAFDMIQAMQTGHDGSISSCHANSSIGSLYRLESLVLMSDVGLPLEVARIQVASSLDLVIQVRRAEGGYRQISEIVEVGYEKGEYKTFPLVINGKPIN